MESLIKDFCDCLEKCIRVVAVMRLAIDSYPILLVDENIAARHPDVFSNPYDEDFVRKYIGIGMVEEYKKTKLYSQTFNLIRRIERPNQAVFDLMNDQYIDLKSSDQILEQIYLLDKDETMTLFLFLSSEKAIKVYSKYPLPFYWSERKSNRKTSEIDLQRFKDFLNEENKINRPYDEAYISVFTFFGEPYYVEHNELLSPDETEKISTYVFNSLKAYKLLG